MMWIFRLSIGNSTGNATEPRILVRTGMHMANEQYQQNNHKWKTWQLAFQTLERYRYSELVFKSLDCFTVRPFFSTRPITTDFKSFSFFFFFFFGGGGGGGGGRGLLSSNAFTIWCCIPIARPPRVIRRFKRRSCYCMSNTTLLLIPILQGIFWKPVISAIHISVKKQQNLVAKCCTMFQNGKSF